MKDLYYRFKTVDQLSIPIAICLELVCFVSEEIKDRIGGVASLEGLRKGMCSKVYTRLFSIVGQGSIKNGLKVRRGVRCRRHREGVMGMGRSGQSELSVQRRAHEAPRNWYHASPIESLSCCHLCDMQHVLY